MQARIEQDLQVLQQEAVAVEARIEQWSNMVGNLCGSIGAAFEDGEWSDMVGNLSTSIGDALEDGAE